jgi:hypothetical protein
MAARVLIASVSLLAVLLLPASCGRGRTEKLNLPPTPILTIRATWAAVKSPLLRVRSEPTNKAEVLSHIRTGVVVEVIGRSDAEDTVENDVAYWYRINYDGLKGWVFGSYLEIFDSRGQAEKYAETLQ